MNIDYGSSILSVVGAPVTQNGDLKNQFVETNVEAQYKDPINFSSLMSTKSSDFSFLIQDKRSVQPLHTYR